MNVSALGADWSATRSTLQHLATHVLCQARFRHDGLFDLQPSPGGFATPAVGPSRERVRLSGESLIVERVIGTDVRQLEATTISIPAIGSSISALCDAVGFAPDPDFWVGDDTPALGDPDATIGYDPLAAAALGDWYLLGQHAIDTAIAPLPNPEASTGRLWPEHFDYGLDLNPVSDTLQVETRQVARCNLGAAAGDGFHDTPYLYVGPWSLDWDDGPPGDASYWNAPFGAVVGAEEIATADDPLVAATAFFATGLEYLRLVSPD